MNFSFFKKDIPQLTALAVLILLAGLAMMFADVNIGNHKVSTFASQAGPAYVVHDDNVLLAPAEDDEAAWFNEHFDCLPDGMCDVSPPEADDQLVIEEWEKRQKGVTRAVILELGVPPGKDV